MAVLRLCFLLGVALVESLYALSCLSCDKALCLKPINCKGGYVKGVCGCCDVCAKIQGERCGGPWHIHGQCAKGFKCVSRSQMKNQKGFLPEYFQTGICEPDACEQKECGFHQVCIINRRGKPVCKCPRNCGKLRKPVCGLLNGKQYRNKCKLNREECITKTEIGMLAGKCKKCTFKGQKYKFGETRPDVKPCEICTCRHSSWKCQMKPNCSMNNLPKYTNGRHTCLVSQDGKDFVLPCPKGFACKLPITDKKLDTVLVGVCKKEKVETPQKVPRFFEIICYSNIALTKEDLSEKKEGTKSPTSAISEFEFSAEIHSTKPNTDFVSTVAPTMGTLKKQQLKGGLIRHVCMAKADKGTCRPALLTRWFYNASSKSCEQFKYGGCAGNFNNFLSKEKCQEVCHSELNHRDLWEPSPTTQSSPLFMTTKLSEKHNTDILMEMCHDMKTGMSYRDGEKWSLDECTSCTCVSGRALCIAANCRVTCLEPRKIEGKCCPECEPDLEHSDISGKAVDTIKTSCEDTKTGVRYNSGESWSRNECVHCNCFNGETSCMTSVCAKPLCEHPITRDGVCCPVCPEDEKQVPTPTAEMDSKCKDQSSRELYSIGEAWNVNECVTCFCGKEGQSICHELTCLELKCKNPVHLQGRCCPVCPESFLSACTYDNRPYFQGDLMLLEDMCTLCKCDGNAWNCTDMHCNKSANGIDSSFNIKLEKLDKVKQDRTPNDGWENLSNEELDEFIVEDPMRMTRQSNKKQIAPNDKEHSPTTTSINQELFAMFNKRKSSTSSRTNDESYPVDTLIVTNENIDKLYTEKPQLGSTDKPDANIKTQSLLKEYKNRMWPSGYEDIFRASNYTTIYRTKRL